jgi:arginine:pyruvate transaminase
MAARTLTVGSMSKSHAMTGSRLGWVAGPAEVIADMIQLATHTTYGVAGFIQEAALFALDLGPGCRAGRGRPLPQAARFPDGAAGGPAGAARGAARRARCTSWWMCAPRG